ncbi:MAG: hypothetical protein WDA01_11820 [Methanothrix sp.]
MVHLPPFKYHRHITQPRTSFRACGICRGRTSRASGLGGGEEEEEVIVPAPSSRTFELAAS